MSKLMSCVLVAAIFAVSFAQEPTGPTGNTWRALSNQDRRLLAAGFLQGMAFGMQYRDTLGRTASVKMFDCLNGHVDANQLAAVVDRDIRNHPETWHVSLEQKLANSVASICPTVATDVLPPDSLPPAKK